MIENKINQKSSWHKAGSGTAWKLLLAVILLALLIARPPPELDEKKASERPSRLEHYASLTDSEKIETIKEIAYTMPPITKANLLLVLAANKLNPRSEYALGSYMMVWAEHAAQNFGLTNEAVFFSTNMVERNKVTSALLE